MNKTADNPRPTSADVVVVGSGAAGLTAAIVLAASSKNVVLLEKTGYVGGTTAWSGGVAWVPDNHLMAAAGLDDSLEKARQYIASVLGEHIEREKVDAFLANCRAAFEFLDTKTSAARLMSYPGVDYYPDNPSATSHRGVMVPPYDGRELGEHLVELQPPLPQMAVFGSMQVDVTDVYHLQRMLKNWESFVHSVRLVGHYAIDRLVWKRGTRLIRGNALAARLYRSALDLGVTVVRNAPVTELRRADGRITGVIYTHEGQRVQMQSRLGVILASGGVSASERYRQMLMPFARDHVSMLPLGNCGDGVDMALAQGGLLGKTHVANGCLTPVSVLKKPDGSVIKYPHLAFDRCKPGSVMVDRHGRRFTNESASYHDVGRAMQAGAVVPAYLIADAPFLRWYGMGLARPFPYLVKPMVEAGYLVEAPTLDELARKLDIDPQGLAQSVARNNELAKAGSDPDHGRGGDAYNRSLGDAEHGPNPCLGQIRQGPFYAVRLYPGDIGTLVGLQVNTSAQVLDGLGQPIVGLYACGLDINSVFSGFYPSAGCTHGPNITFAYVAAQHLVAHGAQATSMRETESEIETGVPR